MNDQNHSLIYIIEDSEEDFHTIKRAFKKSGVRNEIERFTSGDDALDVLFNLRTQASNKQIKLPGLILLDLNLPGMDGREVLRSLKSEPTLKEIPVIILSTSGDDRDIEDSYKDGANSYIKKPVEFENFVKAISTMKNYWIEISILPKPKF